MYKKIVLIINILLLFFTSIKAQKEQNNWFFGFAAGLTWNTTTNYNAIGMYGTPNATLTGMPTNVTGSLMNTYEGCFAVSDMNGNLLFFSDGITIWNKNKAIMTNGTGLTGNSSSAQSGIIFPYPYSTTRYVAVTLGERNANNLSYSIIDMSQNGGFGAVESLNKNKLLTGQSGYLGESVTAVRHTNRNDFWIVAVGRSATSPCYLNVWKATSAGVQANRHSSAAINVASPGFASAGGYIRFTRNGKHFVWVSFPEKFFAYGDFNSTTGMISNVKVRTGATGNFGYGVEFSPNDKYLYLTYAPGSINVNSISALAIYDFDALLVASDPNNVNPLKTIINGPSLSNGVNDHFGAIQVGPDNRMYMPHHGAKGMYVITNPDTPLSLNIYKLNNILTGIGYWGVPSFAAPWFRMILEPPVNTTVCAETITNYAFTIYNGMGFNNVSRIVMDFGDGEPNSIKTILSPSVGVTTHPYRYKQPGNYTITITAYNSNNGIELTTTTAITVHSCILKVNTHIRGNHK